MHSFVEEAVFTENEQDDESHVDVMRVLLLSSIQDLQDWYHLKSIPNINYKQIERKSCRKISD